MAQKGEKPWPATHCRHHLKFPREHFFAPVPSCHKIETKGRVFWSFTCFHHVDALPLLEQ